jgi:pyruvate dehydrogenase E2 component (dihydrolipoamide acetyltransferase)
MATQVILPKVDMAMEEGTIHAWKVAEGATVKAGDLLFEIETDKANMEIEAPAAGVLGKILVKEGVVTPVGAVVAYILAPGEKAPEGAAPAASTAAPKPVETIAAAAPAPVITTGESTKLRATPLARSLARQSGVDLSTIHGSGPRGRIVAEDVRKAKAAPAPAPAPVPAGAYETIPHDNMRRTIARRLVEAKQTVPHFYLTADCDIGALLALREEINKGAKDFKLSVNDFVVKALGLALRDVPDANVSWTEAAMLRHASVDVAVAVSMPGGLMTPVVRDVPARGMADLSNTIKDLASRARARKLKPEEYQGGSSAVSNLGMYGVREFAAIINPPHATILAVGAGEERAVSRNGQIISAQMMSVTLSADHRAVDGALAAELLKAFRNYIERPLAMLV